MIRVMSFNIRYGEANDGVNSWPNRRALAVERIRHFDPDLLGLQECLDGDQAAYIQEQLSDYEFFARQRGNAEQPDREMAPILYRRSTFEQIASGCFWISDTPEREASVSWGSAHTRIAMWVRLRLHGRPDTALTFINTHLDYRPEPAYQGAKRLRRELTARFPDDACILTGDFNLEKTSPAYHALVENGQGFYDTFRAVIPGDQDEGTFHDFGRLQSRPSIDWLLATDDFKTIKAGIDRYHHGEIYPSDHHPIYAVLTQST